MKASENALTLSGPGRLSVIDSSAFAEPYTTTHTQITPY